MYEWLMIGSSWLSAHHNYKHDKQNFKLSSHITASSNQPETVLYRPKAFWQELDLPYYYQGM